MVRFTSALCIPMVTTTTTTTMMAHISRCRNYFRNQPPSPASGSSFRSSRAPVSLPAEYLAAAAVTYTARRTFSAYAHDERRGGERADPQNGGAIGEQAGGTRNTGGRHKGGAWVSPWRVGRSKRIHILLLLLLFRINTRTIIIIIIIREQLSSRRRRRRRRHGGMGAGARKRR